MEDKLNYYRDMLDRRIKQMEDFIEKNWDKLNKDKWRAGYWHGIYNQTIATRDFLIGVGAVPQPVESERAGYEEIEYSVKGKPIELEERRVLRKAIEFPSLPEVKEKPKLGFWKRFGWLIILILVIAFIIYVNWDSIYPYLVKWKILNWS